MAFFKRFLPIVLLILQVVSTNAQDKPIGYWESHLPYCIALGLATDGNTIYTICPQAFFTLNGTASSATPEPYSKVEGMSDIGMQCVTFDMASSTAVLIYSDGNIDLFKDNTFYNVPDLKIKTVAGAKTANEVYAENGLAYLSTSLGVIVVDLNSHGITETIQFNYNNSALNVNGFVGVGDYFYAATSGGVYRAEKNNPSLQNFQVWSLIDSTDSIVSLANVNNTLFMANRLSVFTVNGSGVQKVYTASVAGDSIIEHIDAGNGSLLISEFHPNSFNGDIKVMNTSLAITDTFTGLGDPKQAATLLDNSIWVADAYNGLTKLAAKTWTVVAYPPGPGDPYCYDIYVNNKNMWIAHGGFNDLYYTNGNGDGVSNYSNGKWKDYKAYSYQPFDTLRDFVAILKDEITGYIFMGSYQQGLFILRPDGSYQLINTQVFDSSNVYANDHQRQVTSLAFDQNDNLWVSIIGLHQLYRRSATDSSWSTYYVPTATNGGALVIDDNNLVWFSSYSLPGGLSVFNPQDSSYRHLTTGVGAGNLPSNHVFSLAKDKNNQIWVGTDNGIGILSGCAPSLVNATCDANIPIVQYDQFAGYLFAGNNVRTIAVDGANRKWVGTDNGVWLLSPDASSIVYRFTQDNSPLPSNNIEKISIDKVTGDVYIGTVQGLITFRSTATEGGTSNNDVTVFPNPVQSGYTGTIAIKGLVANADVRITDIDGQLVYKTKALGGQAVWGGTDYTGHRPQSGVYLIFASSSDGAQTYQGKIVFMH